MCSIGQQPAGTRSAFPEGDDATCLLLWGCPGAASSPHPPPFALVAPPTSSHHFALHSGLHTPLPAHWRAMLWAAAFRCDLALLALSLCSSLLYPLTLIRPRFATQSCSCQIAQHIGESDFMLAKIRSYIHRCVLDGYCPPPPPPPVYILAFFLLTHPCTHSPPPNTLAAPSLRQRQPLPRWTLRWLLPPTS